MRVLRALGCPDLGQLDRARERMLSQVRGDRGIFPLVGSLGLAAPGQYFPVGADVLLIQALDHARVHLAGEAQPGGGFPGPLPGRLPSRGVVRHGTRAPAAALPPGEVGNVVTLVERHSSRHDKSPPLN